VGAPGDSSPIDVVVPAVGQASILVPIAKILSVLLELNIILGVFNLVPVPPLDGSHVLESLLPYEMARAYASIRQYGIIPLIGLMMTGVFGYIIRPVFAVVGNLLFG